ncbi:VIT1/CCC1 transporter family protein [Microvirga flavescens]|uniref:VIT1/CCC1 transporter family protein n=1 Tax=Microvirga flavescens TaxID=2249811 RepID=UPI000DDAF7EE|nr:VIT1/CCC1 transporter family protein [Microvirga flavescens]
MPKSDETLGRWHSEKTAAYLSAAVAEAEPDPQKAVLFRQMADAADRQAALLASDLGRTPVFHPALRARIVARLTKALGPKAIRPILSASKVRGISVYSGRVHQPVHAMPTRVEDVGRSHRSMGGGTLRAAVFGVNDGVISNTCLVMGVSGAAAEANVILISGVAGLLAGAFSMAAGEYISMLSQREMLESQIGQERSELERYPAEEAEELALIYAARGIPLEEARTMTRRLVKNPEQALNTLAREELGLNPEDLGSPIGAAVWSFLAFSVGAILPLLPFLLGFGAHGVRIAAVLAGLALFIVGAALSLFSGQSALKGGLRMLLIGAIAAAATYFIGALFNVSTA